MPKSSIADIDLGDLRLFVKIAEAGGLTVAAKMLGIPKTSATRQLQRLERALGCRLVHRSGGRFALTEEGREFLSAAAEGIRAIDVGVDNIQAGEAPLSGPLRISSPYTFGRKLIAPHLPAFMRRHPGIVVTLLLSSARVDLLADEADIAIRVGSTEGDSLIARRLQTVKPVLCATPAYLAQMPPLDVDTLGEHPFIELRSIPGIRHLNLLRETENRRVSLRTILRTNEPEVVLHAVMQDMGVGLLPADLVRGHLEAGRLVICLESWHMPMWDINALYAPGRGNAPRVRAFLDHLFAHINAGDADLTQDTEVSETSARSERAALASPEQAGS